MQDWLDNFHKAFFDHDGICIPKYEASGKVDNSLWEDNQRDFLADLEKTNMKKETKRIYNRYIPEWVKYINEFKGGRSTGLAFKEYC